ncbi:hypothetical protein BH10PAT3_BH10PAT3_4030 [soil metagenome]
MELSISKREITTLSLYLIGEKPSTTIQSRFRSSISQGTIPINPRDESLLFFVRKNAWSLPYIDAGLAFYRPDSEVRRRLFILLAILEATPEYVSFFIPKKRSPWYFLAIIYAVTKAIAKATIGIPLILMVQA